MTDAAARAALAHSIDGRAPYPLSVPQVDLALASSTSQSFSVLVELAFEAQGMIALRLHERSLQATVGHLVADLMVFCRVRCGWKRCDSTRWTHQSVASNYTLTASSARIELDHDICDDYIKRGGRRGSTGAAAAHHSSTRRRPRRCGWCSAAEGR